MLSPGDLYVAATDVDDAVLDFRKGIRGDGRILHCAADLSVKRELRTGEVGLVVGLALDPASGVLYSTNPQCSSFVCFDRAGVMVEGPSFLPSRRFGNMVRDQAGRIVVGVHSLYSEAPDDGFGDGKLVRFDPARATFEFFDVEYDGGRGGRHCVSGLSLAADGKTVFYVSEAGRRVLRYDMEAKRQLPDFLVLAADDPRGTYGLSVLPDGNVLMAMGTGVAQFDPQGGEVRRYDVPDRKGWTRARLALDGTHFYLGNFLDGTLQRRSLADGSIVAEMNVGRKGSLTSIAEYLPG